MLHLEKYDTSRIKRVSGVVNTLWISGERYLSIIVCRIEMDFFRYVQVIIIRERNGYLSGSQTLSAIRLYLT